MKASVRTLIGGIVDYAGLFPPAHLDMGETVSNFARYRADDYSWALGRLVVPAARLGEMKEAAEKVDANGRWLISALIHREDWRHGVEIVTAFNDAHSRRFLVDTVEMPAPRDADEMKRIVGSLETSTGVYFETPLASDFAGSIAGAVAAGARVKARTGGVQTDMFPAATDVARFLVTCRDHNAAFKFTAGMHHPLRASYRLTYEPDSPTGVMHGFLNAFVAAAFAGQGWDAERLLPVLEETSAEAFDFGDRSIVWRSQELGLEELRRSRAESAISFGSCSFEEPIDDLKGLALL